MRTHPIAVIAFVVSLQLSSFGQESPTHASASYDFLDAVADSLARSYLAFKLVNDKANDPSFVERMTANKNASIELQIAQGRLDPFKSEKNEKVREAVAAITDAYGYMRKSLATSLAVLEKLEAAKSEEDLSGLRGKISDAKVIYQQASRVLVDAVTLAFGSAIIPDPKDPKNHVVLNITADEKGRLLKAIESRFGPELQKESPDDTGPLQAGRLLAKYLKKDWKLAEFGH
jgi:hypothetical protein